MFAVLRSAWRCGRRLVCSLVLLAASLFGFYCSGALDRAGAFLSRSARWASSACEARRLRVLSDEVRRSHQALTDLCHQRRAIDDAVGALETGQQDVSRALGEEEALLRAILEVRAGHTAPRARQVSRDEVEQDAARALRRVEEWRVQFHAGAASLARLTQARALLDQRISSAEEILARRAADLHRQQAQLAGEQAFTRGLEAAGSFEERPGVRTGW